MLSKAIRISILLAVVLGAVLVISAPAAAQVTSSLCTEIGRLTNGRILVDVEGSSVAGAGAIQCSVLADWRTASTVVYDEGTIGTPRVGYRVEIPSDQYFGFLASVDVFVQASTVGGRARNAFGWFEPEPVRVCFKLQDTSLQVGSLDNSAPELNDVFVMFSDARVYQDARNIPARDLRPLNIVAEGLELGFVCADIDTPGTVSLVESLGAGVGGSNVFNPVAPNRCTYAGQTGCVG